MDEPTSALDPTATRALEELGRSLADEGMPILWVTHDLSQADRIADRRIVLVGGRLADEHQVDHYLASDEAFPHHHEDDVHQVKRPAAPGEVTYARGVSERGGHEEGRG